MRALLVACTCLLVFPACKRESIAVNDQANWPCGNVENLDSATIHARLMGEWQLMRQSAPTGQVLIPADTILVKFSNPADYTVTRNGELVSDGSFTLVSDGHSTINNETVSMWRLSQTAASEYLGGYVFVCGTELTLVASFYDGMDQYFEKK